LINFKKFQAENTYLSRIILCQSKPWVLSLPTLRYTISSLVHLVISFLYLILVEELDVFFINFMQLEQFLCSEIQVFHDKIVDK
jgi:hypothetical protein